MSLEAKIEYHRTFRSKAEVMRIAAELKRRRGHLGGVGGKAPDPKDHFRREHQAYLLTGGKLQSLVILERNEQKFEEYATPWEWGWSSLVNPTNSDTFAPVVDGDTTVIGHYGSMTGGHFSDLVIPVGTPTSPGISDRKSRFDINSAEIFTSMLASGVRAFVHDRNSLPPYGWAFCSVGTTEHKLTIMTTMDGEVLEVISRNTGFVESVDYSPADILAVGKILVTLGAKLGSKVIKSIVRQATSKRVPRAALDGPTAKLAKEVEERMAREAATRGGTTLFKGLRLGRGYDPRMGIPEEHFKAMVEAAKETGVIAMFRANKSAAIPLIRKGAPGKPMYFKFKTSAKTGALTAEKAEDVATAYKHGAFVVDADGVARRRVMRGGKEVTEEMKLQNPSWTVEKGQVIDPDTKLPYVGDYDLLGVAPIKSPGRSIATVPDDVAYGDWIGPDVKKYAAAVNKKGRMDRPRVLHGAQDQYGGNPKYMGLTDDTAYAVFPDGRSFVMVGRKEQEAFYAAMGRQAKQPGAPVGKPDWKPKVVK